MNKEEIIKRFKMIPHIEGGYFKETYRSSINYKSNQTLYSSILFLLGENDISHLHILKEDELWYYQGGDDCTIIELDENLNYKESKLGIRKVISLDLNIQVKTILWLVVWFLLLSLTNILNLLKRKI